MDPGPLGLNYNLREVAGLMGLSKLKITKFTETISPTNSLLMTFQEGVTFLVIEYAHTDGRAIVVLTPCTTAVILANNLPSLLSVTFPSVNEAQVSTTNGGYMVDCLALSFAV